MDTVDDILRAERWQLQKPLLKETVDRDFLAWYAVMGWMLHTRHLEPPVSVNSHAAAPADRGKERESKHDTVPATESVESEASIVKRYHAAVTKMLLQDPPAAVWDLWLEETAEARAMTEAVMLCSFEECYCLEDLRRIVLRGALRREQAIEHEKATMFNDLTRRTQGQIGFHGREHLASRQARELSVSEDGGLKVLDTAMLTGRGEGDTECTKIVAEERERVKNSKARDRKRGLGVRGAEEERGNVAKKRRRH